MTNTAMTRPLTSKVYSDILEGSGITLTNGRYITAFRLIAELQRAGVSADDMVFLRDIGLAGTYDLRYGKNRDVLGSGFVCHKGDLILGDRIKQYPREFLHYGYDTTYTFNRWDLAIPDLEGRVGGPGSVITDRKNAYKTLRTNPKSGVKIIRGMYSLFAQLPNQIQDDYLGIVDSHIDSFWASELIYDPKSFLTKLRKIFEKRGGDLPMPPTDVRKRIESVYNAILAYTAPEHQEDIKHVLRLLLLCTMTVGKGAIVRKQIDDLLGFDIASIPTEWQEGNLENTTLTEERIRGLNGALAIEDNYQAMKELWDEIPDEAKPENLFKPLRKQ